MTLAVLLTTSAPFDIRFENMLIDMIVIINIIKLIGQQADGSSIGLLSTTPFFESILIYHDIMSQIQIGLKCFMQAKFTFQFREYNNRFTMSFNYRNYVTRYNYQPYCWPPDLGLSELHARCSQPGPVNEDGVQCPCCGTWSKKKIRRWWKRNIDEDLQESGTAIPGYFQLIKYYSCFALLVLLINSIYPIYVTYYACTDLDPKQNYCLEVGALYYLEFNQLIALLHQNKQTNMIDILYILQTTVFYILLAANYFSIIFITFLNDSARREFTQLKNSEASRCLVFYNIPKKVAQNLQTLLNEEGDNTMNIIKRMQLYQIRRYFQYFAKRNRIYYNLLSLQVIAQNPLRVKNLNKMLERYQSIVMQEKQKFHQFSGRVVVLFQNVDSRRQIHSIYRINFFKKWWYGFRSLLKQYNIYNFDQSTIKISTYELGLGSDVIWQNLGQQLGNKMAIRIKTFFVAIFFIIMCYIILYYPMVFSLKAHIKSETSRFVKLNTFEKILPNITSFALVALSIYFRIYMDRLSDQRNPKNQLEKARFVLITCLTFHLLFYVLIPTFFFLYPGQISETVKLYVISQQARTFIVVQVIIVLVDLPYRIWKSKKVRALSDQRVAFKNNQYMLHKLVQCRDYPLQIRLQVLFRIWSLVLFYSFFIPYMMFYIIVAFLIIFWIEKHNLYKHYTIRRKVSIKLQSEVLMYYVNFFCIYICFIYCYTVQGSTLKILLAIGFTLTGLIINIVYWIVMNKADAKSDQILLKNSENISHQIALLKKHNLTVKAQQFIKKYHKFLQSIQNDNLDEEIANYLIRWKQYQREREVRRKSQLIELQSYGQKVPEPQQIEQSEHEMQQQQINQNQSHNN